MSDMVTDPRHPAWTRIPLVAVAVFILATLLAVYDLNAHGNQDAWAGIVLAPLGALVWGWVYWRIRRSNNG